MSADAVAGHGWGILRQSRRIAPDRETIFRCAMTQVADAMASATNVMTGMLGAVAAVSLLVGGIGIIKTSCGLGHRGERAESGIRIALRGWRHILV